MANNIPATITRLSKSANSFIQSGEGLVAESNCLNCVQSKTQYQWLIEGIDDPVATSALITVDGAWVNKKSP